MDLSKVIHLSSNDVTNALLGFFSVPVVLAVLALLIALCLVPLIVRAVRHAFMAGGLDYGEAFLDVPGGPSLVSEDELTPPFAEIDFGWVDDRPSLAAGEGWPEEPDPF